jgi:hypothetical protein
MSLAVNGHDFSIAAIGPDIVVLRDAIDHPPAEAEITMSIDGHRQQWRVELIDGIVAGREDTRIRRCPGHVNGQSAG